MVEEIENHLNKHPSSIVVNDVKELSMVQYYYFDQEKFVEELQLDDWEIIVESIDWNRMKPMMELSIQQDELDREEHVDFYVVFSNDLDVNSVDNIESQLQ